MRAGQTFRVLLNAPVLKKMTVGDGRGKEPNGKSFSFGVVENGSLVPYLLKVRFSAFSIRNVAEFHSCPILLKLGRSTTRYENYRTACLRVEQNQNDCIGFTSRR